MSKFKSVNELKSFDFSDAEVTEFKCENGNIYITIEALIVLPENSQNTNYTKSYAGTVNAVITGGQIMNAYLEGFKYFDANDNLVEEQADKPLNESEIDELLKGVSGAFIYNFSIVDDEDVKGTVYDIAVEFVGADNFDPHDSKSYWIRVSGGDVTFSWDQYMNRVQN